MHSTSHGGIIEMLEKLRTDVGEHLEQVRGEWQMEENRLNNLIQEKEAAIFTMTAKIRDDTETMENERANVLEADQKMHGLNLKIEADQRALKAKTKFCDETKEEFEADKGTRLQELAALSQTIRTLTAKFDAARKSPCPRLLGL